MSTKKKSVQQVPLHVFHRILTIVTVSSNRVAGSQAKHGAGKVRNFSPCEFVKSWKQGLRVGKFSNCSVDLSFLVRSQFHSNNDGAD